MTRSLIFGLTATLLAGGSAAQTVALTGGTIIDGTGRPAPSCIDNRSPFAHLVALRIRDLSLCAKDLFVAAVGGRAPCGTCQERATADNFHFVQP